MAFVACFKRVCVISVHVLQMLQIQLRICLIYYQILWDHVRTNKVDSFFIAPDCLKCSRTLSASCIVCIYEKYVSTLIIVTNCLVMRYLTYCHHIQLQFIPRSVITRLLRRSILWILPLLSWFSCLFDFMRIGTHFLNIV